MTDEQAYTLRSVESGKTVKDDGFVLQLEPNSFLRTEYPEQFKLDESAPDYAKNPDGLSGEEPYFWKYRNWLPVTGENGFISTTCEPIVLKSKLAESMGFKNTWLAFNGYWPEKGALYPTGTIKDLEAITVMQRAFDHGYKPLVVASDGNTGRAIAYMSARTGLESFIVVPEDAMERLWFPGKASDYNHLDSAKLIVLEGADYADAIATAAELAESSKHLSSEGGAKNVGRRDGMAKAMLAGSLAMGETPHHYFQAVGSSPGAVAAYEESVRLRKMNGRFTNPTQVHVAQNSTFCPIVSAWNRGSPVVDDQDIPANWEELVGTHFANELTNRHPAYSIRGGIYDILKESQGSAHTISAEEAMRAGKLFREIEGIDIVNPAMVTVGAFIKNAENGSLDKNDHILLNITGGGYAALQKEMFSMPITASFDHKKGNVVDAIKEQFDL